MATYRVFVLGNDDHIIGADVIDCPSDDEAMARAPCLAGTHQAVEVWELGRRVGRVDLRHPVGAE
jgi:hypothetical protein